MGSNFQDLGVTKLTMKTDLDFFTYGSRDKTFESLKIKKEVHVVAACIAQLSTEIKYGAHALVSKTLTLLSLVLYSNRMESYQKVINIGEC